MDGLPYLDHHRDGVTFMYHHNTSIFSKHYWNKYFGCPIITKKSFFHEVIFSRNVKSG